MSRLTKLLRRLRHPRLRWGEKLVFLHLPKTGGTTLHAQIASQFAAERMFPGRLPGLQVSLAQYGSDYDVFSGHFTATEVELIPGPKYLMTVLRDPKERLISQYYFLRRQPADVVAQSNALMQAACRVAQSHNLLGFLRHRSALVVADNAMARMLAGNVSRSALAVIDGGRRWRLSEADVVERAIASLDRFHLIGFTERLDDAYRALARDWGFSPVDTLPHVNTRREDCSHLLKPGHEEPITRAIEAELDRLTVLDRQVIEHARMIHNRRFVGQKQAA